MYVCMYVNPHTGMAKFHINLFIWVFLLASACSSFIVVFGGSSCYKHNLNQKTNPIFEQKTDRFWEFHEKTNTWVQVVLPFDLVSCVNGNCTKVGMIDKALKKKKKNNKKDDVVDEEEEEENTKGNTAQLEEGSEMVLRRRKRISLTRMSDTSIWVTGESGSIYERFWNGLQWVIAPHDLPPSVGPAVSVFLVNHTNILALSEAGNLYQLQLNENSQPIWYDFMPTFEHSTSSSEDEASSPIQIKTGTISYDEKKAYFSTINGSLLELTEAEPRRWICHGRPPGGNVAAIVDIATIRTDVVFTVSSAGDLYEFDRSSKPSWRKHISTQDTLLAPSKGCTLYGMVGTHSLSLFLLTKAGYLVERRLYQRKWKWISHKDPKAHHLTSITPVVQDELNDKVLSLFFNTDTGSVLEYRLPKHPGVAQGDQMQDTWVNHMHPLHAKVARGIPGIQLQTGRIMFSLDDGRLAELHLSGIGGEGSGPSLISVRRKMSSNYEWSVLDAPQTEGWNAEYCTEDRGPLNCITGTRDEPKDLGNTRPATRRRKGGQAHQSYLTPSTLDGSTDKTWDPNIFLTNGISTNFRMRVMNAGRSFFFVTDNGMTFEYLYADNIWLWLRHEHPTSMKGALGNYNGSLFLVDTEGNLLIRERNENELAWINCTAMRKGRQVIGGPPWDGIPGITRKVTAEDALFFVSKTGRLVQFTVSLRKFKWKDCRYPPNTKIASIVDQEMFRESIVYVVGRNGRLYQYNKVTELWHKHDQSLHLVLSRFPGTAIRLSSLSLTGSIFMITEDGGLVEYQWNTLDGWNWVEHGTPYKSITLVGAPGPCLQNNQLFLIGSDGEVYLRYMDGKIWKWKSCGFPSAENMIDNNNAPVGKEDRIKVRIDKEATDTDEKNARYSNDPSTNCDRKVASVRAILFSDDSLIFQLRDGRLAELQRIDDRQWSWSRIIGTPTSLCLSNYWTTLAS